MVSSLSFGFSNADLIALFGLAFATVAGVKPLNLACTNGLGGSLYKRHAVIPTSRDSYCS